RANELHYAVLESTHLLFSEGNPAGVKAGLAIRNICKPHVRLPLVDMSETGTKNLRKAMQGLI
ncbi:MAG: 4-hydroxy-tetrahydrodipicolinate synthase, partial [Candidatus Azotimanducaceae bacterium]